MDIDTWRAGDMQVVGGGGLVTGEALGCGSVNVTASLVLGQGLGVVVCEELAQTLGNVLPELLLLADLDVGGHVVLGLHHVEASVAVQSHLDDSEVGAAHVEGEVAAGFLSGGPVEDPGGVHGDVAALLGKALGELLDEVVRDLSELVGGNGEDCFQLRDLFEQVSGDVCH